ncbi:MAG: FxsA family protein [Clostridia bacterium]|nr:FxsA family protein [Clostridia bacterium]
MFAKLLLLFTIIPIVELVLLINLGERIGTLYTVLIIVITGLLGVFLAKSQGLIVIRRIKDELCYGNMPEKQLLDGLLVLVGGILLVTPGIITDITGFLCILPRSRDFIRKLLIKKLRHMFSDGTINIFINRW